MKNDRIGISKESDKKKPDQKGAVEKQGPSNGRKGIRSVLQQNQTFKPGVIIKGFYKNPLQMLFSDCVSCFQKLEQLSV